MGVDDTGDTPSRLRHLFEYLASGLFVVAGVDEADFAAAEIVDAYVRGIFYIPAFFSGLDKFIYLSCLRLA